MTDRRTQRDGSGSGPGLPHPSSSSPEFLPDAAADAPDRIERLAAHLGGGARDDALLDEAAASDALASVLADVAVAVDRDAPGLALPTTGLSPWRRAEVLGAFGPTRRRVLTLRRVAWAAALLVVATPVAVFGARALGWGRARPAPALSIASVVRLDVDGRLRTEAEATLPFGARLAPSAGERWSVGLLGGGRVVVGDDDVVRVACDVEAGVDGPAGTSSSGRTGARCERAALELAEGEALLEAAPAGVAVLLLLGAGRLEVLRGAAHVALGTASVAEVALRDDGQVRWRSPRGETTEWSGPGRVLLQGERGTMDRDSRAEASLFRDLAFFGGAPVSGRADRRVSARAFRVLEADGASRASEAGAPALRFDLPTGGVARLAWTLDEVAAAADDLRLLVRVRSALSGPEGAPLPDTVLPRVVFEVEEVPGAAVTWEPPEEHRGPPGGTDVLTIRWPPGRSRPGVGDAFTLRVRVDRGSARVWFEGAAFRRTAPDRSGEVDPRPSMGE